EILAGRVNSGLGPAYGRSSTVRTKRKGSAQRACGRARADALFLTIMLSVVPERTSEDLDLLFGALADATRRRIVDRLAVGEATATELAAPSPSASRPSRDTSRCSSAHR